VGVVQEPFGHVKQEVIRSRDVGGVEGDGGVVILGDLGLHRPVKALQCRRQQ